MDVEAPKKLFAELLAEPEPGQYEEMEPDYEYVPAPLAQLPATKLNSQR